MRPRKGWTPEKGPIATKTSYETRGKVHLVHYKAEEPPELAHDWATTWCGIKLENCNYHTSKVEACTCQKCFMVMTGTWRKKGVK